MANWQALADRLNSEKSKRNAAPGYKKTISITATAVPSTIEALLKDINDNDDTVYNFDTLSSTLPEDDYYSSMSTKIKFIEKKIIPNTECPTYNSCKPHTIVTCKPHTITTCNPHTMKTCNPDSWGCRCDMECGDTCSCDRDRQYYSEEGCSCHGVCGCNTVNKPGTPDYWCTCESQYVTTCSCDTVCGCNYNRDTCCDSYKCGCQNQCSSYKSCSHCNPYTSCPSNCSSYTNCPSNCTAVDNCLTNCACHNVCTCVFV